MTQSTIKGYGRLADPSEIAACAGHRMVFDVETTGLHWWKDQLIGVGFYDIDEDRFGYVPTATYSTDGAKPQPLWIKKVKEALVTVFENPDSVIIGHNLKFDAHFADIVMWNYPAQVHDTTVMIHLLDSRSRKSLDLAEKKYLGSNSKRSHIGAATEEIPKKYKKQVWRWPLRACADYCVNDVVVTAQLAEALAPEMRRMKLLKVYAKDMRYLKALQRIERDGFLLDPEFLREADEAFTHNLKLMEQDLYDGVGYEFNWRSSKKLSKALYEDLGIPKPVNPYADADGVDRSKFADRGMYNSTMTSSFILMEKANHPLAMVILDLRETYKLRGNVRKWLELRDENDTVHATFRLTGTKTGRLSCSEPNLQNIPSQHRVRETQSAYSGGGIRSEEYNLRQAFIARPGHKIVKIDHKQQEMRLFGILSQDPNMVEVLTSGADIHTGVALAVWGDCGEESNKLHREWAKTVGFGLIYGMTTGSLQHRLNKTKEESNKIAQQYWERFPRIQPWLKETMVTMERYQYVRYWSGRIWREHQPDMFYRGANAQIQGGAADLMSIAVMRCMQVLDKQGWGRIINIVHDEIDFEILEEYVDVAIPVLCKTMEVEDLFNIPFRADASLGDNFGKYGDYPVPFDSIEDLNWEDYI